MIDSLTYGRCDCPPHPPSSACCTPRQSWEAASASPAVRASPPSTPQQDLESFRYIPKAALNCASRYITGRAHEPQFVLRGGLEPGMYKHLYISQSSVHWHSSHLSPHPFPSASSEHAVADGGEQPTSNLSSFSTTRVARDRR
jgi:hypothetical protein